MALDYKLVNAKPTVQFQHDDGTYEKGKDLFTKTYNDELDLNGLCNVIQVTREYIARPDLISFAVYGTDEHADILCKLNGISNPFELNEGMILIIPNQQILPNLTLTESDPYHGFITDESTQTFIEPRSNYKKAKNEKRSPNEATVFDHNYIISDDKKLVYY